MQDFYIPLLPGGLYHVLNRANGSERLFRNGESYRFFLEKYRLHISPVAETLAWCLLPQHYHFLIRVKQASALNEAYEKKKGVKPGDDSKLPAFVMQQFSNWQNSYAKAYNKVYLRTGSLFTDYMRRLAIEKDKQLGSTLGYIPYNPVRHGFARQLTDWAFTSYKEYTDKHRWVVDSREVLEWFGSVDNFQRYHQEMVRRKQAP